ncbi:transmembrane and coiled-coil domains protein 1 isoform X1 [Lates calcarifer]|uniref:Transmembrane and coiled-coil domains protein 1 isoform X1 n=2 Tax=Lates calcarifer TaxID=8187 RepID=A0AAJ7V5N7_LATCA|nr:transmembrane and coiled-coil domains protein 1 isoform X1 [Lates calcarifer]
MMPGDRRPLWPLSAVVSKLGGTSSLIYNKSYSTHNIAALTDLDETQGDKDFSPGESRTIGTGQLQPSPKYGSDEDCPSATSGSAGAPGESCSSRNNTPDHAQASGFDVLLHEVQELWEKQGQLQDSLENLKALYQQEYTVIEEALEEERCRCELLEEQLNNLTELHQNEILVLKEDLASMEEKTDYQFYDKTTHIHEALEACQTRISKMELQQQQQQLVQLEVLEYATVQTLVGKLINVLLAVMAVVLVFVSTVVNCVTPLMKTSSRLLSTLLFIVLLHLLWRHWGVISEYHYHLFCIQHPEKADNQT